LIKRIILRNAACCSLLPTGNIATHVSIGQGGTFGCYVNMIVLLHVVKYFFQKLVSATKQNFTFVIISKGMTSAYKEVKILTRVKTRKGRHEDKRFVL